MLYEVITLPPEYYRPLLGLVLFYAAWRLFARKNRGDFEPTPPPRTLAMLVGAVLGSYNFV